MTALSREQALAELAKPGSPFEIADADVRGVSMRDEQAPGRLGSTWARRPPSSTWRWPGCVGWV